MHLSIKVIIATGIFAVVSVAIVGISLRLLAATKLSDEKVLLTESVVKTTFRELEASSTELTPGQQDLGEMVLDQDVRFSRTLEVKDYGTTWHLKLTVMRLKRERALPHVFEANLLKH